MKYYKNKIEEIKSNYDFKECTMSGAVSTLMKVKSAVESVWKDVDYMTYDIEYHGWHGEPAKNMHKIEDELRIKLLEIYAICQMGLGQECEE